MRHVAIALAGLLSASALGAQDGPKPITVDLSKLKGPTETAEHFGYDDGSSRVFYYSNGTVTFPVKVEAEGEYAVLVKASCDEANGQKAKFKLHVDGQVVGAETSLASTDEKEYALAATLKAGDRTIGIEFTNDIYKENEYDLNFYVNGIVLKKK